jgi:hypothetical protein
MEAEGVNARKMAMVVSDDLVSFEVPALNHLNAG